MARLVIDGHGHLLEPVRFWSEYLHAKWRARSGQLGDRAGAAITASVARRRGEGAIAR